MKKNPHWRDVLQQQGAKCSDGRICIEHFAEDDLEYQGLYRGFVVKNGAVPTIFGSEQNLDEGPEIPNQVQNVSVELLQSEITELRDQLLRNELYQNLKVQMLTVKNDKLKEQLKNQAIQIKMLNEQIPDAETPKADNNLTQDELRVKIIIIFYCFLFNNTELQIIDLCNQFVIRDDSL